MERTKMPDEVRALPLAVQAQMALLGRVGRLDQDDLRDIALRLAALLRYGEEPRPPLS